MTEETLKVSLSEGISSQEGDDDVNAEDIRKPTQENDGSKWVKKLLSQRNELRDENQELKEQLEEISKKIFEQEKQKEKLAQAEAQKKNDLQTLKQAVSEQEAKQVEELLAEHPTLTVEMAYKQVNPKAFVWREAFNIQWAVPKHVTDPDSKPKTLEEQEAELRRAWQEGNLKV